MNPYSAEKIIYHLDRILNDRPVCAQWDITNQCNHACVRCSSKLQPNYDQGDEWHFRDIVRVAKELKGGGIKAIEITGGGEPLMHPDCLKIFEALLDLGFELGLVTNGSLIDDRLAKILSHFIWVRISVDALSSETYQVLKRQQRVKYERFVPIIKQEGCVVGASFIIQPENIHEIPGFAQWCENAGFDNVRFSPVYHPDACIVQKYRDDIRQMMESVDTDNILIIDQSNRIDVAWFEKDYSDCYYSRLVVVIAANGHIYWCCATKNDNRYAYGNLLDTSFEEIWHSREAPNTSLCPACWMDAKNKIVGDVLSINHVNFV